jgi:anaerobic selenocysteine-containing dehydrogenase
VVLARKLYDQAVGTAQSPSLAPLAAPTTVTVNPLDLARLGVDEGDDVKITGPRGSTVLPLAAAAAVPRGLALVPFNAPGPSIGEIVDASAPVLDVRIERLS